nr:MAG: hypothetical protein [Sanya scirpophaga incertulas narnavirus 1]
MRESGTSALSRQEQWYARLAKPGYQPRMDRQHRLAEAFVSRGFLELCEHCRTPHRDGDVRGRCIRVRSFGQQMADGDIGQHLQRCHPGLDGFKHVPQRASDGWYPCGERSPVADRRIGRRGAPRRTGRWTFVWHCQFTQEGALSEDERVLRAEGLPNIGFSLRAQDHAFIGVSLLLSERTCQVVPPNHHRRNPDPGMGPYSTANRQICQCQIVHVENEPGQGQAHHTSTPGRDHRRAYLRVLLQVGVRDPDGTQQTTARFKQRIIGRNTQPFHHAVPKGVDEGMRHQVRRRGQVRRVKFGRPGPDDGAGDLIHKPLRRIVTCPPARKIYPGFILQQWPHRFTCGIPSNDLNRLASRYHANLATQFWDGSSAGNRQAAGVGSCADSRVRNDLQIVLLTVCAYIVILRGYPEGCVIFKERGPDGFEIGSGIQPEVTTLPALGSRDGLSRGLGKGNRYGLLQIPCLRARPGSCPCAKFNDQLVVRLQIAGSRQDTHVFLLGANNLRLSACWHSPGNTCHLRQRHSSVDRIEQGGTNLPLLESANGECARRYGPLVPEGSGPAKLGVCLDLLDSPLLPARIPRVEQPSPKRLNRDCGLHRGWVLDRNPDSLGLGSCWQDTNQCQTERRPRPLQIALFGGGFPLLLRDLGVFLGFVTLPLLRDDSPTATYPLALHKGDLDGDRVISPSPIVHHQVPLLLGGPTRYRAFFNPYLPLQLPISPLHPLRGLDDGATVITSRSPPSGGCLGPCKDREEVPG